MIRSLGWILTVMLSCAATSLHAQDTLDLLPRDTLLSLSIRNLEELRGKGDKLYDAVDLKVPRPSMLFEQGLNALGITQGLDRRKPMALMMLAPEPDHFVEHRRSRAPSVAAEHSPEQLPGRSRSGHVVCDVEQTESKVGGNEAFAAPHQAQLVSV